MRRVYVDSSVSNRLDFWLLLITCQDLVLKVFKLSCWRHADIMWSFYDVLLRLRLVFFNRRPQVAISYSRRMLQSLQLRRRRFRWQGIERSIDLKPVRWRRGFSVFISRTPFHLRRGKTPGHARIVAPECTRESQQRFLGTSCAFTPQNTQQLRGDLPQTPIKTRCVFWNLRFLDVFSNNYGPNETKPHK